MEPTRPIKLPPKKVVSPGKVPMRPTLIKKSNSPTNEGNVQKSNPNPPTKANPMLHRDTVASISSSAQNFRDVLEQRLRLNTSNDSRSQMNLFKIPPRSPTSPESPVSPTSPKSPTLERGVDSEDSKNLSLSPTHWNFGEFSSLLAKRNKTFTHIKPIRIGVKKDDGERLFALFLFFLKKLPSKKKRTEPVDLFLGKLYDTSTCCEKIPRNEEHQRCTSSCRRKSLSFIDRKRRNVCLWRQQIWCIGNHSTFPFL